ncbi:MAG: response regulator [Gallionella sp.]|nr:response regulator [Gallionella sp.]
MFISANCKPLSRSNSVAGAVETLVSINPPQDTFSPAHPFLEPRNQTAAPIVDHKGSATFGRAKLSHSPVGRMPHAPLCPTNDPITHYSVTAEALSVCIDPVQPKTENNEIFSRFNADALLYSIPVVSHGKPVGLINRHTFIDRFSKPFQRELLGKKPCCQIMYDQPLLVDKQVTVQELSNRLAQGDSRSFADGFIVTDAGHYLGVATGQGLLRAITQMQIENFRIAAIAFESREGVLITDDHGVILRVNRAFTAITGFSAEEAIGRKPNILSSGKHDAAFYAAMWDSIRLTGCWEGEVWNRHKNNRIYPARLVITAVKDSSQTVMNYVASLSDNTERKQAQEEIIALNAELEQRVKERTAQLEDSNAALIKARDAATAASQAKSSFLANMSHEIRTPINGLLGMARIGARDSLEPKSREIFNRLRNSGSHLLSVINDILDFSKIEAGMMRVEASPFHLASIVDDGVSMVAESARSKGLTLSVAYAPGVPEWVVGDKFRLGQILLNLLSNAIKFTERGRVDLNISCADQLVSFHITDTGIGMSETQLAKLFQAFEQADSSTTRKYGGTGLGLAISRNIARLMGGDIRAVSQLGVGSTFCLSLPLPATTPRHEPSKTPGAPCRLKGIWILAVDDVELNRMVLEDQLIHEGARVILANDGQQALERLEAVGVSQFDVVLMDVQMPEMDGMEATRRIAAIAPGLPVIGFTAHAMVEERDKCFAAGMVDHVAKPVEIDTLVAAILRHVQQWDEVTPLVAATAATAQPNDYAPAEIDDGEIIDLSILAGRVGNTPDTLSMYTALFVETAQETLQEMQTCLTSGDMIAVNAQAHRLKSAAFTVGAMRFGQHCQELERMKRSSDLAAAQPKLGQLRTLLELIEHRVKESGLGRVHIPLIEIQS